MQPLLLPSQVETCSPTPLGLLWSQWPLVQHCRKVGQVPGRALGGHWRRWEQQSHKD